MTLELAGDREIIVADIPNAGEKLPHASTLRERQPNLKSFTSDSWTPLMLCCSVMNSYTIRASISRVPQAHVLLNDRQELHSSRIIDPRARKDARILKPSSSTLPYFRHPATGWPRWRRARGLGGAALAVAVEVVVGLGSPPWLLQLHPPARCPLITADGT